MKLVDSNRYFLQGTNARFLHLGTAHHNTREFMCFHDGMTGCTYIEEMTGGSLEFIKDDALSHALAKFFTECGVLDVSKPTVPDSDWLRKGKTR